MADSATHIDRRLKKMVGPFGSPDDVFVLKMEMNLLGSILFAIFATSTPLAPFERRTREFIDRSSDMLGYRLAKGFWTFAMLWLAFAWYLASRSDGFGFGLEISYYATLTGSILANIAWPVLYFVDNGKKQRYWLSIAIMVLGWLSAIAALVLISINMFQNWAVLTARASAIIAAVFVFIHVVLMIGAFVYFYTMQGELSKLKSPFSALGKGRKE